MEQTLIDENIIIRQKSGTYEPYDIKKTPVLIMLIKILYWAFVFVIISLGIYFLLKSNDSSYHKDEKEFLEISNNWNSSHYQNLQEWKVFFKNNKNDMIILDKDYQKYNTFAGSNNLFYRPFQFVKNNTVSILRTVKLEKSRYESSYGGYNLTSNVSIITDNTFSKKVIQLDNVNFFLKILMPKYTQSQCSKERGAWNYDSEACYKFYMLRTLCVIIEQTKRELFGDYKSFKCNGFDKWYEAYTFFPWSIPNFDPSFDDIEASGKKIGLYVSTDFDPFVWASYLDNFHLSSEGHYYGKCGVWCLGIGIFLILIPFFLLVKDYYDSQKPQTKELQLLHQTSFKTNPMRI